MNKFAKSKIVGVAAASLAAVAVASVGFASWIVSYIDNTDISNISVEVGDIQDQSIVLGNAKIVWPEGNTNGKIVFDADSTATGDGVGKVFKASQGSKEYLDFGISLDITVGADATNFAGITAWMEVGGENSSLVASKDDDGVCVISPIALGTKNGNAWTAPTTKTEVFTADKVTTKGSKTIITTGSEALKFGWGKAFGNKNPVYLSDKAQVSTYKANLEKMKSLTFKIHLEVKTTNA